MKKSMGILFLTFALCLAVMGTTVYVVDPFTHYHKNWGSIPLLFENQIYQTAGAAKNLDYDSALLGTSMSENFHAGWFSEGLGWDAMKLSYEGARSGDYRAILEEIGKRENPVQNIVMDLNLFQLVNPSDVRRTESAGYLYDGKWYSDVQYLFNHDAFVMALQRIVAAINHEESNTEEAYTWEDPTLFGADKAYENARESRENLILQKEQGMNLQEFTSEEMQRNCRENLDNIVGYVEMHPETNFYIFFPPYSVLYWELALIRGEFEDELEIYQYTISRLLTFPNVRLFFFQNEEEIISNLELYRDISHYNPSINYYIYESLRDDTHRITEENYQSILKDFEAYITEFDYEELWSAYK